MSEISKVIPNLVDTEEARSTLKEFGEALVDAVKRHPKETLVIGGGLVGLYMMRDKEFKLDFKGFKFEKSK